MARPVTRSLPGSSDVVLAYIVCADAAEAEKIGEALVKEKLVACANVVASVRSAFFWQGRLEKKDEALLLCKTFSGKIPAVEGKVRNLHSYAVPCMCFYAAERVNPEYAAWMRLTLAED